MKRVAILGTFLESNRYSKVVAAKRFRCLYGDEITIDMASESPKMLKEGLGFFAGMKSMNWQSVPISLVLGGAGGPADADFIEAQFARIKTGLESCGALDGVYILNHGAMTTTRDDDPDGCLYALVREAVGAEVPIVTTVDLHANISQRMVDSADVIVSYRTDPHVDQYECGVEAAQVLQKMMSGMRTLVRNVRLPIVPPNVSLLTDNGPYGDLIDYGQSQMSADIVNVSIVGGFAFGDTSANGLHIIVVSNGNAKAAESLCADIAQRAWKMRERFGCDLTPIAEAVSLAVEAGQDSTADALILSDIGDNIGAGGPGNSLALLRSLHAAEAKGVLFGSFFDPALVAEATSAGEGATIDIAINGDDWNTGDSTLVLQDVKVARLHSGRFTITEGPLTGMAVNSGNICLLEAAGIWILVTSHRPLVWPDPALLDELGLPMALIRTLVLKCRSSYRAVFNRYVKTERMIEVDTPGRTTPVLDRHNWQNIPRPAYPIDQDFEWQMPSFSNATNT